MYVEKRLELLMVGAAAPDDLSGTGVHSYSYLVLSPLSVDKLLISVTTIMNGAATVQLKRRPTFGSATGESILASIIVEDTAAVGQTRQKTFKGVELDVGDQLIFEVSASATSGGALYGVEVDNDPEEPGNNPELSEAA